MRLISRAVSRQLQDMYGSETADGGTGAAVDSSALTKEVALALAGVTSPSPARPLSSSSPAVPIEVFDWDALEMKASTGPAAEVGGSEGVKEVQFHLSFQSRVGPVKWLQPYTEETLVGPLYSPLVTCGNLTLLQVELGEKQKVRNLVVVPVSFVSEHIETLEEIDMEYKELAEHSGIVRWRRVPALNTDDLFIDDMADLVVCIS